MNVRGGWWRNQPSARILRKHMKRPVFAIIGTIITKRSSAAFVRTMFCSCFRVHFCPFIQFNRVVALRSRPFMLTS